MTAGIPGLLIIGFMVLMLSVYSDILLPILYEASTPFQLIRAIFYLLFYSICYIMCVWSYFKCVFTHPGPVDQAYFDDYQERYGSQYLRHCAKCERSKPPRCHHCSICKMCVVNMDHHCPWLCNCIGYNNKKFFVLFLFYAFVGCTFITLLSASVMIPYYKLPRSMRRRMISESFTVLSTIFSFSFSVTLLFFGGFHFWLVFNDKTTLETDLRSFLRFGERPRNVPYRRNWCIVMDSNPWIWFIPVHGEDFKFSWDFLEDSSSSSSEAGEEDFEHIYQKEMRQIRDTIPLLAKAIRV